MGAYERLARPLLFLLPPERAQSLSEWALRRRWLWRLLTPVFDFQDTRLRVAAGGLTFPSPVGLAAGYDKNCELLDSLLRLGFGYAVGGTVLPEPRPGNPRPRLMRLPKQHALINALGFPSKGMAAAREALERLHRDAFGSGKPVIVSIAALDMDAFQKCHAALEPHADATELNISSPNTEGIRLFQEPGNFAELVDRINATRARPLLIKLPPYSDVEAQEQVLSLVRIGREKGIDGFTVSNTRPVEAPQLAMGRGGLSGRSLLDDTLRMVTEVRAEAGSSIAINACGGISTADDTLRALLAGADTVQLLTGLVYRGPTVARAINKGLVRRMEERGHASLQEMVAAGAP
jgi:dihydroorotate dehydrogenase subfamily 2